MQPLNRATIALLAIPSIVLLGWLLKVGAGIIQPLVIALLLASMLSPVVRGLARFRIPPFVSVLTMAVLIGFGLARVALIVQGNVAEFLGQTERAQIEAVGGLTESEDAVNRSFGGWTAVVKDLETRIERSTMPAEVQDYLKAQLNELDAGELSAQLVGSGLGIMRTILLVVIYMLFIFAEQAVFRRKILSVAGDNRHAAATILDTIGRGIQQFLGIKTLISIATGALCYVALVALQVPYALLWGVLTFFLNFIPYFGSLAAGTMPTVTALAVKSSWETAMIVAAVYFAVNIVLGSIIEPRILGRELDLSPLVIIVSVVIWGALWGVVGAFLAVPMTATMQIVLASNEVTRPVAVLLSSGPPKGSRRLRQAA
ncbi:AI-2E family transporter [Engelhardtia mirabilis]|uniref:AI-2 transport protein TqsA n=1 Tax=Engelhardtia mirabilis TaxID=2528011 RepID=A0A518BLF2_9BACT|nr:AI-2 transport protein TqsA [Planctomycetes bacterium Pla133]QDV02109.1 AI-2 transport protein TqsA [Planctomycetes bacterium Pla86]